ncbi:hypothetical protein [Aquabacter spiritensis]|uniref:Uncharacterized protein n=1 Tax=Aquabacter spiritensis TaxID=933073 RepID=A0A4R3M463_9HYPH|nr:hypothetical protein [Aquabacter spiritensis]TCT07832.1 hypothetical protein EDC64_101351 [Aquabacter spiritensis]
MSIEHWKLGISIVDVITKSAIAGAIGYATYSLNADSSRATKEKERFNQETSCWDVIHKTVTFAYSNQALIGEQINSIKTYLPNACGENNELKEFGKILLSFIQNRTPAVPPTSVAKADMLSGLVQPNTFSAPFSRPLSELSLPNLAGKSAAAGKSDGPSTDLMLPSLPAPAPAPSPPSAAAGAPATGSAAKGPKGWVAVGYEGTPDFNFTLPDGTPLPATLAAGNIIAAKWSVYVRPRPAGWEKTLATLSTGECFKLANAPRRLEAGTRIQIWAEGVADACP